MYSQKVMEHFKNPKNMGEIEDADGIGEVGNPQCGDVLRVYLEVEKNERGEEYIKNIKFQTFGCIAAVAVSSMLTEIVKGMTLEEAKKLSNNEIIKNLGGLPPIKHHCSLLGAQALKKAIEDYEKKKKQGGKI
ncbi:iron-sulfur cluster assembly scaffold protein [Candidatus Pacearchaeota archaeon RBG_13_36_9]|nr:MAG: iron-sulfur cluster assembly scaffold protein [Candidatus Pacearchaeota archaeon RBG_13_36_9]